MTSSTVIGLLNNAALLLAFGLMYDAFAFRRIGSRKLEHEEILTGCFVGVIGIAIMSTHWKISPEVAVDARSILMSLSGFFFGTVPTIIAIVITSAFRIYLGGAGTLGGIAIIIASAAIGLAWREFRGKPSSAIRFAGLYLFGIIVQAVTLLCMFLLAGQISIALISVAGPLIMLVFPFITALLGKLMAGGSERQQIAIALIDGEKRYRNAFELEDISESRQKEKALEEALFASQSAANALAESERQMRSLIMTMPVLLMAFDENRDIVFWNSECERSTGYTAEEVFQQPTIMENFYPDAAYREFIRQQLNESIEDVSGLELDITCKDGTKRTISWTRISGPSPISGWAIWAIGTDLTVQKRAEKQKDYLEARIRQLQKIEAIGALAAGIAHDFNNILYPILGFAELAREDIPQDSPAQRHLDEIVVSANRASDLVKQLLTYSRQSDQEVALIYPQTILSEVVKLARSTLPKSIAIVHDIDPDCDMILANSSEIHQMAMNLITNAYHAMQELGGQLTIGLKNIEVTEEVATRAEITPGPYVLLSVADTGSGINKVIMDRIFDPYFSTKPKDQGSGLGLSIVLGVVKSYRGGITVQSATGKGTAVEAYFPAVAAAATNVTIPTTTFPGGKERILVVEYEEQILRLEKLMLERLGYSVSTFTSAPEALAFFRADPAAFDLVMTDINMPNMTGETLFFELKMTRKDIPVILCTSFSELMTQEKATAFGIEGFLMKPIVKSELAQLIRSILDKKKNAPHNE